MPCFPQQSQALPLPINLDVCRAGQAKPPIANATGQIIVAPVGYDKLATWAEETRLISIRAETGCRT